MIRGKKKVPALTEVGYLQLKVRNGYALTPCERHAAVGLGFVK